MKSYVVAAFFATRIALLCIALAPAVLAQSDSWDKEMKNGEKAYADGLRAENSFGDKTPRTLDYFAKAEHEFLAALMQTQSFAAADPRTAHTVGKLVNIYTDERRFDEAAQLVSELVSKLEASLGPDDRRLGIALMNLAKIYAQQSKVEQAASVWSRSLAILKKSGGLDSETLSLLNAQARSSMMGPASKEQIYQFILELKQFARVPDQDVRAVLEDLASAQRGPAAEQTYARILEIDKKIDTPDNFKTSQDLESLAKVYNDEGKYVAEIPVVQRVLEFREKNAGLSESDYKKSINQSAILCLHSGRLAKSFYGSEMGHLNRQLAEAYTETGRDQDAEALLKELLSADEADSGPNLVLKNNNLTVDWMSLSRVYRDERRYGEAMDALDHAAASNDVIENSKFGKIGGSPSVWVWNIQTERAEVDREKGDTAAAEPLFQGSLQMADAMLSRPSYAGKWVSLETPVAMLPGNPPYALLLDHYANLLRDEGKAAEAEMYYKRSLDSSAKSQFPEHPSVGRTLNDYAVLLRNAGRRDEAQPLEERASAIFAKAAETNSALSQ